MQLVAWIRRVKTLFMTEFRRPYTICMAYGKPARLPQAAPDIRVLVFELEVVLNVELKDDFDSREGRNAIA